MAVLKRKKVMQVIDVSEQEEVKKPVIPATLITQKLREFRAVKDAIADLQKKEKKQKEELDKLFADIETDSNGHAYMEAETADGKPLILARQARKSISINVEKAKEFFSSRKMLPRFLRTRTEEYIDEAELQSAVEQKELSVEDMREITDTKVVYATAFIKARETEEDGK